MGYYTEAIEGTSDQELLELLAGSSTSTIYKHTTLVQAEIALRCTARLGDQIGNLTETLEKASKQSSELTKKIVYLTWVLAGATVVLALLSGISLYSQFLLP